MTAYGLHINLTTYWTPAAVTQLANVILIVLITIFLFWQYGAHRDRSDRSRARKWIALTFLGFTLYSLLLLSADILPRHEGIWLEIWITIPSIFALFCYSRFAYIFPQKLAVHRLEFLAATVFFSLILLAEIVFAMRRFEDLRYGYVTFRPNYMDIPIVIGFFWCLLTFVRQVADQKSDDGPHQFLQKLLVAFGFIFNPFRSGTDRQKEARACFWVSTLLLVINAVLALRAFHFFSSYLPIDLLVSWLTVGLLCVFTFNYLNSIAERTTLMIKVIGVTMITLVTVVSSLGWSLQGVALNSFQPDKLIESGTAYRFTPTNNDGYTVSQIDKPALQPSSEFEHHEYVGPIEIGFSFPFYGEAYTQLFPHPNGLTGLKSNFYLRDIYHEQSHTPVIIPAAVSIEPSEHPSIPDGVYTGIFYAKAANHITIYWRDFVSQSDKTKVYNFRVRLHRSGLIDFIYDTIPDQTSPDLNNSVAVIFLSGLSPGRMRTALSPIAWLDEEGVTSASLQPLRQDFVKPLRIHLDTYFRPLAKALLITALIIVAIYPVLFLHMLIRPLGRLMQAIEEVKNGRSTALKSVGRDEISHISETMNAMSVTLYELVNDLETKVEERASRIANLARDNARLTERDRLSAELHDSVAQTLFASNLISDRIPDQITKSPDRAIENIKRVKQLNQDALKEVRNLLEDLRPAAIAEDGLCTLLQKVADKFCTHASLTLNFHSGGNAQLPEKVQMVFLRVLQECLHNIHKHAEATSVDIECDALETQAILIIRDNGKGFQTTKVSMGSFGLEIMRERLQSIAADLDINSVPGQGTTITVIWFGETHV